MQPASAPESVLTAYAKSLIKYKARQLTRKPEFSRSDEEDVAQELTVYLLTRAHLFDPNRALSKTFADRVIKSAIAMMLRDRRRLKRAPGFSAQSIEQTGARPDEPVDTLRDALTEADLRRRLGTAVDDHNRSEAIAAVLEAFQSLPSDLQDLCHRLIAGSEAATAREMGISRRQLRKAIERIRVHFESTGLKDF